MMSALDTVAKEFNDLANSKGFYDSLKMDEFNSQAKQLMMITSEVVEVMEALRKNKGQEAVMSEMADIMIRLLDFYWAIKQAGVVEKSFTDAIIEKHNMNRGRPMMHGNLG